MGDQVARKLTAILAADAAGYSRLVGADEEGTLARFNALRREVIEPILAEHRGRLVKTMGDGFLAEFASVVNAARCAIALQEGTTERNAGMPAERRIRFRIGVHLGNVVVEGDDILGDGVNVAARLEGLAEPGSVCLSGAAYEQVRDKLPFVFDDLGPHALKNIARPMRVYRIAGQSASSPARTEPAALALPDKPSIAVLPFDNMSSDPEQSHFSDGITEDIIMTLSCISTLFVIARNSTFVYKGKSRDLRQVGRELGVRYVLEGSVRRAGNQIRVTAQLINSTDGAHLWADRYDRRLADVFDIQDELTKEIVTALRVVLTDGEQARLWHRSTDNVSAWADAMRGVDHLWRGTAADMATARKFLTSAVEHDPGYAQAIAMLASTYYYDIRFGYTAAVEEAERRLVELTDRALALNPDEPYAVTMKAAALSFEGRFDEAVKTAERAAAISPNDAFCWIILGQILINAERHAEAERAVRTAMRLNPLYPVNYLAVLGDALLHQGRNAAALNVFAELVRRNPNFISAHLHLAGLYGEAGEAEQAREEVGEVLRINPAYRLSHASRFYLSSDMRRKERFLDALRRAGLPE